MRRRAFTLLEVVIATGVFAVGVVGILALLPLLARESAASADAGTAQALPDALQVELRRLSELGGFDALATRVPLMGPASPGGLAFVAARSGAILQSRDYLPPQSGRLDEGEGYYLLEVWRFPSAPLTHEPGGTVLPLFVQVAWPHRLPGNASPVPVEARSHFRFVTAIDQ